MTHDCESKIENDSQMHSLLLNSISYQDQYTILFLSAPYLEIQKHSMGGKYTAGQSEGT